MRSLGEHEIFDAYARESAIAGLRHELELPPTPTEHDPALISPLTMGIEIEETWREALPTLRAEWRARKGSPKHVLNDEEMAAFHRAYSDEDTQVRALLERTLPVIPNPSSDGYWEFSFHPTKNLNYTKMEADCLFDAGLLRDGFEYPLHLTVAGLASLRDAYAFASAVEMSGGTTPRRLAKAQAALGGAWASKSFGGIRERTPGELIGDDTTGHEIRTLCVTSREQLTKTLGTAARIATTYHSEDWSSFRADIEARQRQAGLALVPWAHPKADASMWTTYAELL